MLDVVIHLATPLNFSNSENPHTAQTDRFTIQPTETFSVDRLTVQVYESPDEVALAASAIAHHILQTAIANQGQTSAIFATGRSQIQFLYHLTQSSSLDWSKITGFHLDEYLGIAADHPASFRQYLRSHLTNKVPLKKWHSIDGDGRLPLEICRSYEQALRQNPIDLCCLGIGNNGHLAFNDPAVANFTDPDWVKIVRLDEQNRQQQVTSSAFADIEAVPRYAFTLTLSAIQSVRQNICLAFGENKAEIISKALTGSIGTDCPASILRQASNALLLLDRAAARKLRL